MHRQRVELMSATPQTDYGTGHLGLELDPHTLVFGAFHLPGSYGATDGMPLAIGGGAAGIRAELSPAVLWREGFTAVGAMYTISHNTYLSPMVYVYTQCALLRSQGGFFAFAICVRPGRYLYMREKERARLRGAVGGA